MVTGILLATGLGPAFRHTHEIAAAGSSAQPQQHASDLIPISTHWHLVWLGWEFTFDSAAPPISTEQDETTGSSSVVVASADDHASPLAQPLAWTAPTSESDVEATVILGDLSPRAPSRAVNLLCDAARFERSGVQQV